MSLYIYNKSNNENLKAHHPAFAARSKEIVAHSRTRIANAVERHESLTQLFDSMLTFMAVARKQLAIKQGMQEAERYGVRRDSDQSKSLAFITHLIGNDAHYEKRMTALIHQHLTPIQRTPLAFQQTSLEVTHPACFNMRSVTQYEIFNPSNNQEFIVPFTPLEYTIMFETCGVDPKLTVGNALEAMIANKAGLRNFKAKNPELYKKFKLIYCFAELKIRHEKVLMSDWVVATQRLELEKNRMFALSQMITWTYRNYIDDPVDQIPLRSKTAILRQDPLLIESMLKKVAEVFERAIRCKHITWIKKDAALMKYLFVHARPFLRGSTAISEWLEQTVYLYHGYQLHYNPEMHPTYEALTLPWNDFYNKYDTMYSLSHSSGLDLN
ncbi:MAG: hypothetical protein ACK5MA_08485 [Parachlamydiaceae bacterium]